MFDRFVKSSDLFGVNTMTESCINDDRDNCLGVIVDESHDGIVELLQTGLRTALSGNVRTVHNDVFGGGGLRRHIPSSEPLIGL